MAVCGPHPLGVQPGGNAWLAGASATAVRKNGLGCLGRLSDAQVLAVLEYLDGPALSTLGCCSRAAHAFASHADLWRTLVLSTISGGLEFESGGWKATYVRRATGGKTSGVSDRPPVQSPGLYSDLLFKSWLCSAADVDPKWLAVNTIERRSAKTFSVADFVRDFESANRPVIISDCISQWPAASKWTPEHLTATCGDASFDAGGFSLSMAQYYRYAAGVEGQDDQPLYLFCKAFADKAPALAGDFSVPPYFDSDLFSVLGAGRPDYRWLIVGPKRSGSVFHKDPNATSAWNACIRGSKKWIMFPPSCPPPGVHPSADGSEVATTLTPMEWFLDFYEAARRQARRMERAGGSAGAAGAGGGSGLGASSTAAGEHAVGVGMKRRRPDGEGSGACAAAPSAGPSARLSGRRSTGLMHHRPAASRTDDVGCASSATGCGELAAQLADECDPSQTPLEGVCREGEVIFVPRGWWHAVLNIEDSIAITQNYVSEANLPHVLHFTERMPYAVSGVPAAEADALHGRFVAALREHQPDALARAEARLRLLRGEGALDSGASETAAPNAAGCDAGGAGSACDSNGAVPQVRSTVSVRWSEFMSAKEAAPAAAAAVPSAEATSSGAGPSGSGASGIAPAAATAAGEAAPACPAPASGGGFSFGFSF